MRKVFLSIGSPSNEGQQVFIDSVKVMMETHGLKPLTADASFARPFANINLTMKKADGVIVIALERYFIPELVERRNGTIRPEKKIREVYLPTTWNQVEAAMAHAWQLPLLVMCESCLREDGLLDRGNDWYMHRIETDGSSRPYIEDQLRRFSTEVHKRRRPFWQVWRSLDAPGRIVLVAALLGITSLLGTWGLSTLKLLLEG